MGSNFCYTTVDSVDKSVVKARYKKYQEDCRANYGTGPYGGHMGLKDGLQFGSEVFQSEDEASDWVADNTDKYGPALAVSVGGKTIIGAWCRD